MKIIEKQTSLGLVLIVEVTVSLKDQNNLLDGLKNKDLKEIVFLDQRYLLAIIIKQLVSLNIKISPMKRELWLYLIKLNIKKLEYLNPHKTIQDTNFVALAIGGSVGSIDTIINIVKNLPVSNISVFITIHQHEEFQNKFAELLQNYTQYQVVEASNDMEVEEKTIYIAPVDYHMLVISGFIFLTQSEKINYARPSISTSFISLSNEYGRGLIALYLSGYGDDGLSAIPILCKNHSQIIVHSLEECEAKVLPQNIINTKKVDYIMNKDEINGYLKLKIDKKIHYSKDDIKTFLDDINSIYGYDFRGFQIDFIDRRLKVTMARDGIADFEQFRKDILTSQTLFDDFFIDISINVSDFFRDPEVFLKLNTEIIPYLQTYPIVKIWSAGCSSGEEAYSMAIILYEAGILDRCRIYATDFNETILNEAKNGFFPKELLERYEANYLLSGGKNSFYDYIIVHENYFEIKDEIKQNVLFFNHNLVQDGILNQFHIILCRNVLIYFNNHLQEKVCRLLKTH